jgi:hypothetical protein
VQALKQSQQLRRLVLEGLVQATQRTRATACVYRRLRRFELRAKSQKTLDAPVHVLRYSRERHFDLLSVACGSQLRKVSE